MHGSGTRIVNTTEGIQLEIERSAKGVGNVYYHIFVISDTQFAKKAVNIFANQGH